uniref:Solute carrier organic anion transporter family member n=1 Tax=Phallusia mammillata TaxID=59560 RepID=A0A6F9DT51_9ASCI|nr:solute carrier organic anion transporter family member 5A1 [Phallusia mammillata]
MATNVQSNRNMTLQLPSTSTDVPCKKKNVLCGLPFCTPDFLQRFATPKWFLATISFFVLVQSMLVSGITSSVITTIEERYGLRSAESGLVVSSFDIGSLVVVVFISYFGGKGHRARWVGIGSIAVAIGSLLFAFPQFFSSPYQPSSHTSDDSLNAFLCVENRTNSTDIKCEAQEANSLYLFLFVISNMIMGIGSTPIYTLGTTFIYDNVPRDSSSLYISILYAMGAVGPAVGYLLGGFFLTFYIDLGNQLSSNDPQFLGAWWLGYLLCAGLCFAVSIFLLMFPRQLQTEKSGLETPVDYSTAGTPVSVTTVTDNETTVDSLDTSVISFGKNLKELPKAFLSLLSNPIYLCVTCSATLEFSIVTAFLTFVPKFLQSHFSIDTAKSSIFTGAVLVPSAGTGILLGGYIIKRYKLNMTGCAQTALLSNLLSLLLFISVFLISCEMIQVAGINTPLQDPISGISMPNISLMCNSGCSCLATLYAPICSGDITYYNPCYAGCEGSIKNNLSQTTYYNCSCLPQATTDLPQIATHGECVRDCTSSFIPFLFCLFLVTMATVCAHTPSLMVTYRCVKNDERPFAAGLQFVFFRTLAYIPAPIYFGTAIDQACLLWNGSSDQCENGSGSCLLYDAKTFRYIFFGVAFGLKLLAFIFVFLSWVLCRRKHSLHTHTTKWRRMRRKKVMSKIRSRNNKNLEGTTTSVPQIAVTKPVDTYHSSTVTTVQSDDTGFASSASVSTEGSRKTPVVPPNRESLKLDLISSNQPSVTSEAKGEMTL